MNSIFIIIIISIFLVYGSVKKVNCYEEFLIGAKEGCKTVINMYSYLLTFTFAISIFINSGIIEYIKKILNINYVILMVQILVRPLSSSSSMSIMIENYNNYGVDNNISIISTLINYVSDTSLYIIPFYCSIIKFEKYKKILILGLVVNLFSYFIVILFSLLFF